MKPLIRSAVIMECVANIKYTGISSAPSVCCVIMGRFRKASWSKGKTRKLSTKEDEGAKSKFGQSNKEQLTVSDRGSWYAQEELIKSQKTEGIELNLENFEETSSEYSDSSDSESRDEEFVKPQANSISSILPYLKNN